MSLKDNEIFFNLLNFEIIKIYKLLIPLYSNVRRRIQFRRYYKKEF